MVVNGQIESTQAVDVSADKKKRIREFADEVLEAERGATGNTTEPGER